MQYLVMQTDDIRTNLATEQYLMNSGKLEAPFMLFYIEKPCIIVGRNQNTMEEINQKYCEDNKITITRRLSGGGAMYQDLGNMCFSFVVPAKDQKFGDFKTLVQPIVKALHEMGATKAEVTGRNDIVIDGKKFSGNAMYTKGDKTFSHGTLMFDVDTSAVENALRVSKDKIESKGVKSVRSHVTNIKPYLDKQYQALDTFAFHLCNVGFFLRLLFGVLLLHLLILFLGNLCRTLHCRFGFSRHIFHFVHKCHPVFPPSDSASFFWH